MAFITKMHWDKPALADVASHLSFRAPIWQHNKLYHGEKKFDLRSYNVTHQNLLLYVNYTNISSCCSDLVVQHYHYDAATHSTRTLMQQSPYFLEFLSSMNGTFVQPSHFSEIHIRVTLGYSNQAADCSKCLPSHPASLPNPSKPVKLTFWS